MVTPQEHLIALVAEQDLGDLLPLLRAYCNFYGSTPSDEQLLALARALLGDPEREGMQLIARDHERRAVGFATLFWTWETNHGGRIAVMNDLFVAPEARGSGLADGLIAACAALCRERGVRSLQWQTALDNHRAQAVYDRVGGKASRWLDYELTVRRERSPGDPGATS